MKKFWQVGLAVFALNIIFGVSGILAQDVQLAGAYADASTSDAEVVSAARYAVRAQSRKQRVRISLIAIERAEVQVVAGLNYRLQLKVKVNGAPQNVATVVYKNLRQKYSLTSWEAASNGSGGASAPASSTIEQLVGRLAEAFVSKSMGDLDQQQPAAGRVRIVIEHSLAADNDKDRFEIRSFSSLAKAEQWLRSREREELPNRESRPLLQCRKGICTYDFEGGILHNHLYLKKIRYGFSHGRPFLHTIYLLDGD